MIGPALSLVSLRLYPLTAARAVARAVGVGPKGGTDDGQNDPLAPVGSPHHVGRGGIRPGTRRDPSAAGAEVPKEIPLYAGTAPGSEKWDWTERTTITGAGRPIVTDVVRPVLQCYPAEKGKAVGAAMIVAPGGGFRALMMSYEGADIARRLSAMGVDAFILKYRLVHGPAVQGDPAVQAVIKLAADDGRQAVRLARERAGEFGYRPDRVGMIGFSAGGMVTSEALFGPAETRPNFAALIYGAGRVQEVTSPAPPCSSRSRPTTRCRPGGRSRCSPPTARARAWPSCTSSRRARTASSTRGAAPTISWTAWKNGSRPTSCSRSNRTAPTPRPTCQAQRRRASLASGTRKRGIVIRQHPRPCRRDR